MTASPQVTKIPSVDEMRALGRSDYQAYLRSDHWQRVKRRYRRSKMPQTCVVCGDPRYQLHHKTYERLGREHLTDLVALCELHHTRRHVERTMPGRGSSRPIPA